MDEITLNSKIITIELSYQENDVWIYVKMQSLLEYVLKAYLSAMNVILPIGGNLGSALDQLAQNSVFEPFISELKVLNRTANSVKHYSKNRVVDYSKTTVDSAINTCNKIIKLVFPKNTQSIHNKRMVILPPYRPSDIVIPACGDESGTGLIISGLVKESTIPNIDHSIFATIYGFLLRSRIPQVSMYVKSEERRQSILINPTELNNYQYLILMLIRHGYLNPDLHVKIEDEKRQMIRIAYDDIMNYADMLTALCKATRLERHIIFDDAGVDLSQKSQIIMSVGTSDIPISHGFAWKSERLNYQIDIAFCVTTMKVFLQDFFHYDHFHRGQLETIVKNLNEQKDTLSILPTGTGKSLIFYFCALLINGPTLVITPTDLLIEDQIRNLEDEFGITNSVAVIDEVRDADEINNYKFVYCSSEMLLYFDTHELIVKQHNRTPFMQIVVDEVHTISSWSHDFRPGYLMLSSYLKKDFPISPCRCFTATANYKVVKDIMIQLDIDKERVVSTADKVNPHFHFHIIEPEQERDLAVLAQIRDILAHKKDAEKIIVFTHSIQSSQDLWVKIEAQQRYSSVYLHLRGTYSYSEFVDGDIPILIAEPNIGIGINLKNIKHSLHFEIPHSVSQYIQEIGRTSRDERNAYSYVFLYLPSELPMCDKELLSYDTSIKRVIDILQDKDINSPVVQSLRRALGNVNQLELAVAQTKAIAYHAGKGITIGRDTNLVYMYTLFVIGIILDWHYVGRDAYGVNRVTTEASNITLSKSKSRLMNYIKRMGNYPQYISESIEADNFDELINIYYRWWYNEYVYYQREQLITSYNFYLKNKDKDSKNIIEQLNDFYSVSILDIATIEDAFSELSIQSVLQMTAAEISRIRQKAYQILLVQYNVVLDLILFMHEVYTGEFNEERLERVLTNMNEEVRTVFINNTGRFYPILGIDQRYRLIQLLQKRDKVEFVLNAIYATVQQDEIYTFYMIKTINENLEA